MSEPTGAPAPTQHPLILLGEHQHDPNYRIPIAEFKKKWGHITGENVAQHLVLGSREVTIAAEVSG